MGDMEQTPRAKVLDRRAIAAAEKPVKLRSTRGRKPKAPTVPPVVKEESNVFMMPVTSARSLKVVFLGGIGEIGKNMTALEYGDDIIVIDCGLSFPTIDMPGIDSVIPDTTYLMENKDRVRGIFITHGHEDHIGAVPYVLQQLNVPLYASALTLALLEHKLEEHKLNEKVTLVTATKGSVFRAGCFSVEYVKVNHSVAGSFALNITTPVGTVFHTGDFKVDYTPVDGEIIDLHRIAEIGKRGVHLLLCESTNVERPGYSMSESAVGKSLDKIFADNAGKRLFIATFASNVHRLQQIMDLAEKYGRKVAFSGRSMLTVCEAASKIGELKYDPYIVVDVEKIERMQLKNVVVITTGAQGEPMSALTRMASGEFSKINIGYDDTIVISASPIPGNEKMVYNVINNLYRLGAHVIYESLAEVHASGHACQEEIKLIHALTKPKFFIPVHGEYRHLEKHAELAVALGMPRANIVISDTGSVVEVDRRSIRIAGSIPAENVFVDGSGIGDIGAEVLRDRKHLSADGLMAVFVNVDQFTGEFSHPEVVSRGFVYAKDSEDLFEASKDVVESVLSKVDGKAVEDWSVVKTAVRKELGGYLYRMTKRRPMIIVMIVPN